MEEFQQITLMEWMEWKEDIRRTLQETAGNFVHIGFRLRQIRDSGMYGGCEDVFAFAREEYGLSKSTVSRFIAINEKFSEGGYSIELRKEYKAIGSSKLAEMLTLTDAECTLITEKTTVKEIRELKSFSRQQEPEPTEEEVIYSPLQKCIIDYFAKPERKEMLNQAMEILSRAWQEQQPDGVEQLMKEAAENINPGEYTTHKKGIVFLFLYDWNTGVKYKLLTEPEPVAKKWTEFLWGIYDIFKDCFGPDTWANFYGISEEEKVPKTAENQGVSGYVATSQQEHIKGQENQKTEQEKQESKDEQKPEKKAENRETIREPEREDHTGEQGTGSDHRDEAEPAGEGKTCQEGRDLPEEPGTGREDTEDAGSAGHRADRPGLCPAESGEPEEQRSAENDGAVREEILLQNDALLWLEAAKDIFLHWSGSEIPLEELQAARRKAERFLNILDELIRRKTEEEQLEGQMSIEDVIQDEE